MQICLYTEEIIDININSNSRGIWTLLGKEKK